MSDYEQLKDAYGWTAKLIYKLKDEKKARLLITPFWAGAAHFKWVGGDKVPTPPTVSDVLGSLVLDARHSGSFEEFCMDTGYSSDSRAAERLYETLKTTRQRMIRFLGEAVLERLEKAEY